MAQKIRRDPSLPHVAIRRLLARGDRLFAADLEWLDLLRSRTVEEVARLLESDNAEGQRLRSSTPFSRDPFVSPEEAEAIRERAYVG